MRLEEKRNEWGPWHPRSWAVYQLLMLFRIILFCRDLSIWSQDLSETSLSHYLFLPLLQFSPHLFHYFSIKAFLLANLCLGFYLHCNWSKDPCYSVTLYCVLKCFGTFKYVSLYHLECLFLYQEKDIWGGALALLLRKSCLHILGLTSHFLATLMSGLVEPGA